MLGALALTAIAPLINVGAHDVGAYGVGAPNAGASNVGPPGVGILDVSAHVIGAHNFVAHGKTPRENTIVKYIILLALLSPLEVTVSGPINQ